MPDTPELPRLLFSAERSAEIVVASFADTPNPRVKAVLEALVTHLHAFVKDVRLSPGELMYGIQFLTDAGQMCDEHRQELILLSDVLGVSMLVESLANRADGQVTEATVEGPFHMVDSPARFLGVDLNEAEEDGVPCVIVGRVTDDTGNAVPGAQVDVWQANADGFYDVQKPDVMGVGDLRGLFTADEDGRFWFRSIVPSHYPIPTDGPVGRMLKQTGRHEFRPAHVHFEVSAPDMRTLTTHIFVDGSPYLNSDTVFGVKESLIYDFVTVDDPATAATYNMTAPFQMVEFNVCLQQVKRSDQQQ